MLDVLQTLKQEHVSMSRLLKLFETEIAKVETGDNPDYDLIERIAEYFSDFPAACHHPKEDAIYRRLLEVAPDRVADVGDLSQEHEEVGERLAMLRKAVRNILLEIEVSKPAFCVVARSFIDDERKHMAMEESRFFPLAEKLLSEKDWTEIGVALENRTDPLSMSDSENRFRDLRRELIALGAEAG